MNFNLIEVVLLGAGIACGIWSLILLVTESEISEGMGKHALLMISVVLIGVWVVYSTFSSIQEQLSKLT